VLCGDNRGSLLGEICGQTDKLIIHIRAIYTPSELGNVFQSNLSSSISSSAAAASYFFSSSSSAGISPTGAYAASLLRVLDHT
jgi:hypothetical protein